MIYTRDKLEEIADNINKDYFPDRLSVPSVLDPYDLLDALGCDYEWKYLSPNDSILGVTFFEEGYWYVWPKGYYSTGDKPTIETFKKGSVVINQRIIDSTKNEAICRERFVVAHEAAHWIKDKNYFEVHSNSLVQTCCKNSFNKTFWTRNMTELEIIERQASYLGAAIIMPRSTISDAF